MTPGRDFQPAALELARALRGLTWSELAARVGVSRNSLTKARTGSVPKSETLEKLADELSIPFEFLFTSPPELPPEDVLHFRKASSVRKRAVGQVLARAALFGRVVTQIKLYGRFPPDTFSFSPVHDDASIEAAAENCRKAWGLSTDTPIENVTRLLERAGAFVGTFDNSNARVDAFSWRDSGTPLVLAAANTPPSRVRMNLAHEAGHLVLHQGVKTGDKVTERQAFLFAASLLLPRAAFWREFPRRGRHLDWHGLVEMKRRWGVSLQAILYRARRLGLITDGTYVWSRNYIRNQGWTRREPGEPRSAESPEIVPRVFRALSEKKGISPAQLASDIGMSVDMVEDLTGIAVQRAAIVSIAAARR